jgi:hypothetical protein
MTSATAAAGSFASDGRRRNRETPRGQYVAAARRCYTLQPTAHRGVVRRPLSAGGPFAFLPRRRGGKYAVDAADTTLRRSALGLCAPPSNAARPMSLYISNVQ